MTLLLARSPRYGRWLKERTESYIRCQEQISREPLPRWRRFLQKFKGNVDAGEVKLSLWDVSTVREVPDEANAAEGDCYPEVL